MSVPVQSSPLTSLLSYEAVLHPMLCTSYILIQACYMTSPCRRINGGNLHQPWPVIVSDRFHTIFASLKHAMSTFRSDYVNSNVALIEGLVRKECRQDAATPALVKRGQTSMPSSSCTSSGPSLGGPQVPVHHTKQSCESCTKVHDLEGRVLALTWDIKEKNAQIQRYQIWYKELKAAAKRKAKSRQKDVKPSRFTGRKMEYCTETPAQAGHPRISELRDRTFDMQKRSSFSKKA